MIGSIQVKLPNLSECDHKKSPKTSTNPVQNDNSLSHIEALLSIQLAHLERLTNMTEAALIQSGKIMNDFMVFASAMENFGNGVLSFRYFKTTRSTES